MEIELFFPPNLSSYAVWLGSWGQAHPRRNSTGVKRATPLIRAEHRSKHLVPYIWPHKRIMLYLFPFQSAPHFGRSFEMLMSQTAFTRVNTPNITRSSNYLPVLHPFSKPSRHCRERFGCLLLQFSGWKLSPASYLNQSIWDWAAGISLSA